jgi:hypothetical protein
VNQAVLDLKSLPSEILFSRGEFRQVIPFPCTTAKRISKVHVRLGHQGDEDELTWDDPRPQYIDALPNLRVLGLTGFLLQQLQGRLADGGKALESRLAALVGIIAELLDQAADGLVGNGLFFARSVFAWLLSWVART